MIPWESCVLWLGYPLQNGLWPDISKHDNDGVCTGARWEEDSMVFDGVDDTVRCGSHASLDITEEITFEAIVKLYSAGGGLLGTIIEKNLCIYIWRATSHRIGVYIRDSSGSYHSVYTNVDSVLYNEWTHFVATYDGSMQYTYVNGIRQTEVRAWSGGIKSLPTHEYFIGNTLFGDRSTDGKIALVRIYNKALNAEQAREAYEQSYRLI